jgi:16S rRNA U1498 N3-methylase RsmE
MNIILAETGEVDAGRLTLTDHRAKHVVKVLRAEIGDCVRVGLIDGEMGLGTILAIKKKYPFSVEMELDLRDSPRAQPFLDLILALPRHCQVFKFILNLNLLWKISSQQLQKITSIFSSPTQRVVSDWGMSLTAGTAG